MLVLQLRIQIVLIVLTIAGSTHCDLVKALDPIGAPSYLGDSIYTTNWCECNFLATGGYLGNDGLIGIYQFNQMTETLSLTGTTTLGVKAFSVKWCPSCEFLAVGGYNGDNNGIVQVYSFDQTKTTILEPVGSLTELGSVVASIDWCSSCSYLAVGGAGIDRISGIIQTYKFDPITGLSTAGNPIHFTSPINSLKWCGDCQYLAAVDRMRTLYIYTFDASEGLITATSYVSTTSYNSINWCGNCRHIAAGGYDSNSLRGIIDIYKFDPISTPSLAIDTSTIVSSEVNFQVYSLKWCQGCDNLAVSAATFSGEHALLQLYHFDESTTTLSLIQTYPLNYSFAS